MNEPKRRGRPPKAKEPVPVAENRTTAKIGPSDLKGCSAEASSYAIRVWNGQSTDVPVRERVVRVIKALRGVGLVPPEPQEDEQERIKAILAAQGITVKSIEL